VNVGKGDFVEVRAGRPSANGDLGWLNTVTRVRQKGGDPSAVCRWIPPDTRFWSRVLYCEWMPAEGWVEQQGLFKAWFKPIK
jgi:hypothetical protein